MVKYTRLLLVLSAIAAAATPAQATAVSTGSTFTVINAIALGTAVAYGNGVYLVVSARGPGNLHGHFVQNGAPVGPDFIIQASGNYTHYPRAAFSPDADGGAGAFMVSWNETDLANAATSLHVRLVSLARGGPFGPDVQVSATATYYTAGCPIAYTAGSPSGQKKFLVACQTATYDIEAFFIDNNATVLTGNLIATTAEGERDPSIAFNPVTDQFALVYTGFGTSDGAIAAAKLIRADTGQILFNRILLFSGTVSFISKVVYINQTNQFLASWNATGTFGRLINADGSIASGVIAISAIYGTYDSLGLAYNPITQTTLMVGQSASWEDGAVEIGTNGLPLSSGWIATNAGGITGGGNLYPEAAANTTGPDWLFSLSHNFLTVMAQVVTGSAGGSTAPPPPSPSPCAITLPTTTTTVPFVGGSGTINLTTPSTSCTWTATSGASWITITAGASGSGTSGAVTFSVALNSTGTGRSGTISVGGKTVTVVQPGVNLSAVADFTGDGISDLLARNMSTGALQALGVSGLAIAPLTLQWPDGSAVGNVPLDYKVVGTGDLNGDGYADIVWQQQSTGNLYVWFIQGNRVINTPALSIPSVGTTGWQVRAVADVNGDGRADLIFQNSVTGGLAVWLMNGATVVSTLWITDGSGNPLTVSDPNWVIVGAGDLNRDGKADIVWQNQVTGGLGAWTMNGNVVQVMQNLWPNFIPTDYKIGGVGDVNGDSVADIIWIKQSTGELFVWCMSGFSASVFQGYLMVPGSGLPAALQLGWTLVGPG